MMFWFNKWYSKQRTDYNIVIRLVSILGSQLADSHSPASALAHSRFSTPTVRLLTKLMPHGLASLCLFLALPSMCSAKARDQDHVGLFYETIHLKDRRHIEAKFRTWTVNRNVIFKLQWIIVLRKIKCFSFPQKIYSKEYNFFFLFIYLLKFTICPIWTFGGIF